MARTEKGLLSGVYLRAGSSGLRGGGRDESARGGDEGSRRRWREMRGTHGLGLGCSGLRRPFFLTMTGARDRLSETRRSERGGGGREAERRRRRASASQLASTRLSCARATRRTVHLIRRAWYQTTATWQRSVTRLAPFARASFVELLALQVLRWLLIFSGMIYLKNKPQRRRRS